MTHPFYPLYQQEFELVDRRYNWGQHRVYYHDSSGDLRSMCARYTSISAEDPFVSVSDGRAYFRTQDVLELLGFVRDLSE